MSPESELAPLLNMACAYTLLHVCRLPYATVVERMVMVASALEWIHCWGLVHQDLHTGNVLQTLDGSQWKLIDFGQAVWTYSEDGPVSVKRSMCVHLSCSHLLLTDVCQQDKAGALQTSNRPRKAVSAAHPDSYFSPYQHD